MSNAVVSSLTGYHKNVGKYILLALVLLHIAAILFYQLKKKENLIGPMLHGDKSLAHRVENSRDDGRSRVLAVAVFAICAGLVATMVTLAG